MPMSNADKWRAHLGELTQPRVRSLAAALGVPDPRTRAFGVVCSELAQRLASENITTDLIDGLSSNERLALRLAADGAPDGLPGGNLAWEIQRITGQAPFPIISRLLNRGLLIPNMRSRPSWTGSDGAWSNSSFRQWRFLVRPNLPSEIFDIPVPGEIESWTAIARPIKRARSIFRTTPEEVSVALREILEIIDRHPLPFTKSGDIRAAFRRAADQTSLGDPVYVWLSVVKTLGIASPDDSRVRWRRTPASALLSLAPHRVFAALPVAASHLATSGDIYWAYEWGARSPAINQIIPIAEDVTITLLDAILEAKSTFLGVGVWFADSELSPLLLRFGRTALGNRMTHINPYSPELGIDRIHTEAIRLMATLLDALAVLGVLERGLVNSTTGPERVSRLTPFGAWVFDQFEAPRGAPVVLPGAPRWKDDGRLVPTKPREAALLDATLGDLFERVDASSPEAGWRVTADSVDRCSRAGNRPAAIRARLNEVVPGSPPPTEVSQLVAEATQDLRSALIVEDCVAAEFPDLDDKTRALLQDAGFLCSGAFVLCSPQQFENLFSIIKYRITSEFDYTAPPTRRSSLSPSLELSIPSFESMDLRLRAALAAFGANLNGERSVQLSIDTLPEAKSGDDPTLSRALNAALRMLAPLVSGGVPVGAALRLRAEAGMVDPPDVEDAVLLRFPPAVAAGLRQLGTLAELAGALDDDSFLVAKDKLAAAEEKLSELGVPFPANRSSVRAALAAQAAVDHLARAVADLSEALPERTPEPTETAPPLPQAPARAQPPERRMPERTKPRNNDGDEDGAESITSRILRTLEMSVESDPKGLRLGELALRLDLPKSALSRELAAMREAGVIVLEGRARGARYRIR